MPRLPGHAKDKYVLAGVALSATLMLAPRYLLLNQALIHAGYYRLHANSTSSS